MPDVAVQSHNERHNKEPKRRPPVHAQKSADDEAFVRLETVLTVYPVGKSTWWKGVKEGRFPELHRSLDEQRRQAVTAGRGAA